MVLVLGIVRSGKSFKISLIEQGKEKELTFTNTEAKLLPMKPGPLRMSKNALEYMYIKTGASNKIQAQFNKPKPDQLF